MRIQHSLAAFPVAALVASMAGCTTRSATFEGYPDDQVWSAMVAAARTPEYDDWKIQDNEVMVDDLGKRIEIYRSLKRLYVTPFSDPRKEQEEWRLQVVLSRDESLGAPMVDFTARQVSVPAHVWREADRYFAQVRSLLGPVSPSADSAPAPSAGEIPTPTVPVSDAKAHSAADEAATAVLKPDNVGGSAAPTSEPLPER